MSEHRRPAVRFAAALKLEESLGLFVNLRSLVLAEKSEDIATLEAMTGVTRLEAVDYFLQFHDWGSPEVNAMMAESDDPALKRQAMKNGLRETLSKPLLPHMPEA